MKEFGLYKLLRLQPKGQKDYIPIPRISHFNLTYRCNHACPYCITNGLPTDNELPYETITQVLDGLAQIGLIKISFTGGEPFLRKDLLKILDYATGEKGFSAAVLTNGTFITRSIVKSLSRMKPPVIIAVTLRDSKPEIYDSITRVEGSFKKFLLGLKLLKENGIETRINITLSNQNFSDLEDMIALRNNYTDEGSINFNLRPTFTGSTLPYRFRIRTSQIRELTSRPWYKSARGLKPTFTGLCELGYDDISIGADGKVFPCNLCHIVVGDARKESLPSIWRNSPILNWFRREFKKENYPCPGCRYFNHCIPCIADTYNTKGHILQVSNWYCLMTRNNTANNNKMPKI